MIGTQLGHYRIERLPGTEASARWSHDGTRPAVVRGRVSSDVVLVSSTQR